MPGLLTLLALLLGGCAASDEPAATALLLTQAEFTLDGEPGGTEQGTAITLPDDWAENHPQHAGVIRYRVPFDSPPNAASDTLLALYIERACSSLEVRLNGHLIHRAGNLQEPVTRRCLYPDLVALPASLLRPAGNELELRVVARGLQRVAARERAGGLSALRIGPHAELTAAHARAEWVQAGSVKAANLVLLVLGVVLFAQSRQQRRDASLGYAGLTAIGCALLSVRHWWQDIPLAGATVEWIAAAALAPVVALAVQFLLCHAGLRSRMLEAALLAQCVVLPASLLLAGPQRLFWLAGAWYVVLAAEVVAAIALYLRISWRERRRDRWPMTALVGLAGLAVVAELAVQRDWLPTAQGSPLNTLEAALLVALSGYLLWVASRAQQGAEAGRADVEVRVREVTADIERHFAQLAELRVEQVTERERKRIAADLHDDLGAKLLTIVHTSESERISTLAREALEEMRLSVRGLTGKPVRLADALADWRAETVSRLGQTNIEIDWRGPTEDTELVLPARGYVQTTRILREAVSNIIKHSGASHCKVRCAIGDRQFGINIQDNGRGIPMELDGKLDRGHGMSSMKHRAKQMQGQCLVESGPGYGTVIRLTLPLAPDAPAPARR